MKFDVIKSEASSRALCMPHQQDAVDALNRYFNLDSPKGPQSGLIVMPTGSGKTFTTVNWLLNAGIANGYRILWLVHRQELVNQAYNEFEKQLGCLSDYGIKSINMMRISGDWGHNAMSQASGQDIYICSILSVASKNGQRFIRRMLGTPGANKLIVVIDEAHHATAQSYKRVLEKIEKINPNRILLGLTATPIRMGVGETDELNEMFNAIPKKESPVNAEPIKYIYEVSLSALIKTGFLAKPSYKYIQTQIHGDIIYELSDEQIEYFNRFKDFTEELKKKIASSQSRNQIILKEYLDNRKHYGKTLIFAINQLHAELLSKLFKEKGIKCDYAISNRGDSAAVITNFKEGKLDVLINVQMMTEGVDVPDIQSVFITRETNSDSLLMQMVGRGLRGEKAKGTKEAYITSFHDSWDRLNFWMKPEFVTENLPKGEIPEKEHEPGDTTGGQSKRSEDGILIKDLYEKLYSVMKVNITSEVISDLIPDGWYSLLAEDGSDINVSVYRDQLLSYQLLEASISWIVKNKPHAHIILERYFEDSYVAPSDADMKVILDYIIDNGAMPDYFTFQERDQIDPETIAQKMIAHSDKRDAQLYWLESYYKNKKIISEIYRTFIAFRKSVMDTLEKPREGKVIYIDDRDEFKIVPGYHDLAKIHEEVIQQYPDLGQLPVNCISWSKCVVKSWLGLCRRLPDQTYIIFINRLLCSPNVSKEALKYLLYHELLHANGLWKHDDKFRSTEWKYPNSEQYDGEFGELSLKYKIDFDSLKKQRFDEIQTIDIDPSGKRVKEEPKKENENVNAKRTHKFCRECGNKLPIDTKFCDVCGSKTETY